jgi:hypothetical protein
MVLKPGLRQTQIFPGQLAEPNQNSSIVDSVTPGKPHPPNQVVTREIANYGAKTGAIDAFVSENPV